MLLLQLVGRTEVREARPVLQHYLTVHDTAGRMPKARVSIRI